MIEFSIIVTSYFEEQSIDEFISRLIDTMRSTGRSFEVVLINDGSTDKTYEHHLRLFEANSEISHAVNFFRNFGQLAGMSCGVHLGRGENFVFIDSDLQLDPEDLPALISTFDEGYDIVSGKRKNRRDSFLRKLPSKIANLVMAKVAKHKLTDFGCTFKIYDGRLIRPFSFGPYKAWKTAYVFSKAGNVIEVDVNHHERRYGSSGWKIGKLLNFLFDHMVGISTRPFLWMSLLSLILAGLVTLRLIFIPFVDFNVLGSIGNGFLLNILFLIILLIFASTSILGEYIFRVYHRTEGDPVYVIKEHSSKNE